MCTPLLPDLPDGDSNHCGGGCTVLYEGMNNEDMEVVCCVLRKDVCV